MQAQTKSQIYVQRLLKERPQTTKGGAAIEVIDDGWHVITRTGRAWNHKGYSVYVPCDYPVLFGWDRAPDLPKLPPPAIIEYRGYKYKRL